MGDLRGQGLSTIFLAIWLELCFKLELVPATEKIDKPVISLILQKFGFTPVSQNTQIEVAQHRRRLDNDDFPDIIVWSADRSQLNSTFSTRIRKSQHIVLAEERPINSRTTFVNTCY